MSEVFARLCSANIHILMLVHKSLHCSQIRMNSLGMHGLYSGVDFNDEDSDSNNIVADPSPSNSINGPPRYPNQFYEQTRDHCTPSRRNSMIFDRRQSYSPHPYAPFHNPSKSGDGMASSVPYFNNDQMKEIMESQKAMMKVLWTC